VDGVDKDAVAERLGILAQQVGGATALARLLDLHRSTVFDYVNAVREVPAVRFHLIAARYPCDLEWLLHGTGKAPEPDPKRTLAANTPSGRQKSQPHHSKPAPNPRTPLEVSPELLGSIQGKGADDLTIREARDKFKSLVEIYGPEKIENAIGSDLFALVVAGRSVPEVAVFGHLMKTLGVTREWMFGREE